MHTHTLFELNEHIRRVLALNFQQPVWIVAELAQVGESRGHHYLDLVQKGEDGEIVAQGQAALWASEFRQINKRFPLGLLPLLREGLELRLQVRPEFHERYGLRLHITDVDPAHTLGQLELLRRQTMLHLREQGLLTRNHTLPLPRVLQRIAVLSSENAAGLQDFQQQLADNGFGYAFEIQVFAAAVQGKNAEPEICAALQEINRRAADFDCAVVVRGGGARLDLMAFDGLAICMAAAQLPIPLLVGIGHDVDETVLDLVAQTSLKTPTAVAEYLLQHNLAFEGEILEFAAEMQKAAQNILKFKLLELERYESSVGFSARDCLVQAARALDFSAEKAFALAAQYLRDRAHEVDTAFAICQSLHPANVLRQGFSITRKNGRAIRSPAEITPGDLLETELAGGRLNSKTL